MILDCSSIQDPKALHSALAQALSLPDWYGNNLDALYDCLTDMETDTNLILIHFPIWAEGFQEVFVEAMQANPRLQIQFR